MAGEYSEDTLVEQPAIALFNGDLKWETANCFDETFLPGSIATREPIRPTGWGFL